MIYCVLLKITFFFTSFSREASRWTGLSVIMNCLLISAFAPGLLLTGANCILRIIRRQVSLRTGLEKKTWFDFWHFLFCCFFFFFSTIDNYDTWLTALGFHFGLTVLLCKQSGTVRIIVPFNTVTVLFSVAKMMRYWNKAVSVYNVICFAFKKPKIIQKQSPHSPLCCSVCWIISTYFFSMTSFALSAALARYALTSKSTPQACRQNKT